MSNLVQRCFVESPCSGPKTVPMGWRMPAVANVEKILAQYFRNQVHENQLIQALKNNDIKAVCFDMDGTLVDTEEANWKVIERGCKNRDILGDDVDNITLTAEDKQRYVGTTIVSFLTKLFENLGIKDFATKAQAIAKTKVDILGELLQAEEVKGFDKIISLAKALKREGFKVALVTSSDRASANLVLDHFKLHSCFDRTIVREDMNGRLKPNPYAYNLAMERLEVKPHQTLVFEDSDPGIKSGKDSGAIVVALRNTPEQKLTELRHHNIIPMNLVA